MLREDVKGKFKKILSKVNMAVTKADPFSEEDYPEELSMNKDAVSVADYMSLRDKFNVVQDATIATQSELTRLNTRLDDWLQIKEDIAGINEKLDKMRTDMISLDAVLRLYTKLEAKLLAIPDPTFRCGFCKTDNHGIQACTEKKIRLICGFNNHKEEECHWGDKVCNKCAGVGHSAHLHTLTDGGIRKQLIEKYGFEQFMHFMVADIPQRPPRESHDEEGGHPSGSRGRGASRNRGNNRFRLGPGYSGGKSRRS